MKIFFTSPKEEKKTYQKYIDEIIKTVELSGAKVISPEKQAQYQKAFTAEKLSKYGNKNRAHYEFIRQGIAGADCVIFEASLENFRVGHEATLALMYGKPILVLSQNRDYSQYITHEKFFGKKYKTEAEIRLIIKKFLEMVRNQTNNESLQTIEDVVDLNHSSKLSKLRYKASQGQTYFSDWARKSLNESESVYKDILKKLGNLSIQNPWDVFSKIYHEDTPDEIFYGAVKFADKVLRKHGISKSDLIVDVACGTGSISRLLTSFGYKNLTAFDKSRAMLSEAYKLCAHLPSIKILESDIKNVELKSSAKAMIWLDFSSNFSLTEIELAQWINNLLENATKDGILIFDVRTESGWNVDFFQQKVNTYETDNFQRVSLHTTKEDLITMDIFIRLKDLSGEWRPWEREQMVEKKWPLKKVKKLVLDNKKTDLIGVYGDDFNLLTDYSSEPSLAYFILRKK